MTELAQRSPADVLSGVARHLGVGTPGRRALHVLAPCLSLLAAVVVFYAVPPHPVPSLLDLRLVAVHTMIVGTAAMGMTLVIVSGGIDLSVGSAIALVSVAAAIVLEQGGGVGSALAVALGTGALCGLYNALLITRLQLPPFIATLGTLGFYRGVAKWMSGSIPVTAPTRGLEAWVQPIPDPSWLVLAPVVWLMVALGVVMAILLKHTVLGQHAYAIGSSEATARLCGIRVERSKLWIYIIAGLLTGVAGLMQFARLTQGDPTVAIGLELDIIAAVVIGGGSLAGGQGSILGTLAGAALMAYLRNRCTVLGWPNYVEEMIVGHIIIVAVAIDHWRIRRSSD